jgi:predicted neutral ceramidase superfamily lipid hydrolase
MDELTEKIFEHFKCKHEITKEYIKTVLESINKFDKKQEVFTTDNITDSGEIGIFTRIGDRLSEIRKYLAQTTKEAREDLGLTEDKITKDFLDIGVFGFIGCIYRRGNWK